MAELRSLRADVAVVGAGPAGLAAAVESAEGGARVIVVDANPTSGGQIWRPAGGEVNPEAGAWIERAEAAGVVRLQGSTVFDAPDRHILRTIDEEETVTELRSDRLVLATGARELFLPFPGWTLPRVVGVGALQALIKGGLQLEGQRVVVAGSGPLLLAVAAMARSAGAIVPLIVEQADKRKLVRLGLGLASQLGRLGQLARIESALVGVERLYGAWVDRSEADPSGDALGAVQINHRGKQRWVESDWLACAYGLVPELRLARLLGCRCTSRGVIVDELQRTDVADTLCAGESSGIGGARLALLEGRVAGRVAIGHEGRARELIGARDREQRFAERLRETFALRAELRGLPDSKTIVCRCEDVTYGSLAAHDDPIEAKLQTRCGMGSCQGRSCAPALEFLRGWEDERVRPPLFPVPLAALAQDAEHA